jgi:hypothetical protein
MAKRAKLKDKELKFLLYWAVSEGMDGDKIEGLFIDLKALRSLDTKMGNLSMKVPPDIREHVPVLCNIILRSSKGLLPHDAAVEKLGKIFGESSKPYLAALRKKAKLLAEFKSKVYEHEENLPKAFPIIRKYLQENKC